MAAAIADMSETSARRPSLLPGWTVAHVLTHLARNAEAMHRRIEATKGGQLIDQYTGGSAGRAAEIESGVSRPARELVSDAISWARQLDATFATLPDECWDRPVRSIKGDVHPVSLLPFRR